MAIHPPPRPFRVAAGGPALRVKYHNKYTSRSRDLARNLLKSSGTSAKNRLKQVDGGGDVCQTRVSGGAGVFHEVPASGCG